MTITFPPAALACPVPHQSADRILLGHGSGGKLSAALMRDLILPVFRNPELDRLGDGAVLTDLCGEIVFTTDTFVVRPLEFPGGDIGRLAVHGTLNDLAMMGGVPRYLSVAFVLEEGLLFGTLDRILHSIAAAANQAGVTVVTGDTKVVERGKADGMFINTTGIGSLPDGCRPAPDRARVGDAVILSGYIGQHGMAVMAAREELGFQTVIESDTANLAPLVAELRKILGADLHVLRDPTRGGLASALNEIAVSSGVGISLEEGRIPIQSPVRAACEVLGLDPLYVANEGVLVLFVPACHADRAVAALKRHSLGANTTIIGEVIDSYPGTVVLRTGLGGSRIVDLLPGDQLPRIC